MRLLLQVVLVLATGMMVTADDFFTIIVKNANLLQKGNHSYNTPDDAPIATFYKDISVIVAIEKDSVGIYLSMPPPPEGTKESIFTGVPAFSITLRTEQGAEIITKHGLDVNIATRVFGFRDVTLPSKLPPVLHIEVVLHHPREAIFSFVLENILSVKDGTYDLKPANTSMGIYFVITIANSSVTWYLKRKPPVPPFVFQLIDGNQDETATQVVNKIGADGIGFKNVLNLRDGGINLDRITFKVQFRERFRHHVAFASIKEPQDLVDKLKRNPSHQEIVKPDQYQDVLFQLQYFNTTKFIALMIIQVEGTKKPLGHLQVHVTKRNFVTGVVKTIFLEEERQVPVLLPNHNPQFGWYHVIQTEIRKKTNKTTTKSQDEKAAEDDEDTEPEREDLIMEPNTVIDIEAFYDFRKSSTPEELFLEWINDYGTEIKNFTVHKSHRQCRGSNAAVALKGRQIIGSMPYRLLLTQHVSNKYEWWPKVAKTEAWAAHIEKFEVNKGLQVAASMTFFALMKANSPFDGMNWRLFFDNILRDTAKHHQPIFWTPEELQLLEFSYASSEAVEHKDIIESEYQTIGDAIKWFTESIKKEDYIHMRTHIAARLLNISGVILAAPFVDYLHHDDAPNVVLRFDDKRRKMDFVSARDIMAGSVLSMNYGTETKTKQDFLMQYGWVPVGARDAVMVKETLLTAEKQTRTVLVHKLTLETGSVLGGLEAFTKLLSEKVVSLPSHIEVKPGVDPHRAALMERVLESERYVLHRHLSWVEEDISSMSL